MLVVAALTVWPVAGSGGRGAAAASTCDQVVTDSGADLSRSQVAQLTASARALARAGRARVRVRLYPHLSSGDIADAVRAQRRRCPDWTRGSRLAPDMIVVAVSVSDHLSGLFYGDKFASRMDSKVERIRTDAMHEKFSQGDVEGGLQAGLDGIRKALHPKAHPAPTVDQDQTPSIGGFAEQGRTPSIGGFADDPSQDQPSAPMNVSWRSIALVLGAITGFAATAALGAALWRRWRRRTTARLALTRQRERAQRADGAASAAAVSTAAEVEQVTACISDGELLQGQLRQFEADLENAHGRWQLSEKTWASAAVAALNTARLEQGVTEYATHEKAFAAVQDRMAGLKATCVRVRNDLELLPGRIREGREALSQARARVEAVRSSGLRTPAGDEDLSCAQTFLDEVEAHAGAGEVFAATTALAEAREVTARAVTSADALSLHAASLAAALSAVRRSREEAQQGAQDALVLLGALREDYDSSCWSRWEDGVTSAADQLVLAVQACDLLESAIAMSAQRWDEADTALAQALAHVSAAVDAAAGLTAAAAKTKAAQLSLAGDCVRVQQEIAAAQKLCDGWRADLGDAHVGPLQVAAEEVARITAAGSGSRPPWLDLADELTRVQAQVADRAAAAREAMTSLARTALTHAERVSSSASSYLRQHRGQSHRGASPVDRAECLVTEARSLLTSSPAQALRLAEAATSAAEDGERAVRSAVSAANRAALFAGASAASAASAVNAASAASAASSPPDMGGSSGSW